MKIKFQFLLAILFFVACGSFSVSAQNINTKKVSVSTAKSDIIQITDNKHIDIAFRGGRFYDWLAKQPPKHKFLQSSLEIENLQYVTEWNTRVGNSKYDANLYKQQIDYKIKPRLHYGLDLNYELYMYFRFFEENHEKLLL